MKCSLGWLTLLHLTTLGIGQCQIMLPLAGTSWEFPKQPVRATDAPLGRVDGLFLDGQGNLYLVDTQNHMVFRQSPDGVIQRIAGNGFAAYSGDGATAVSASLNSPHSVVVDRARNVYISDRNNHCIRRVSSDGIITTVAGDGQPGRNGDGGAAVRSRMSSPTSLALDGNENLYFIDSGNSVIRRISTTGIITTIAGNGQRAAGGEGQLAPGVPIDPGEGLVADRNSEIYFTENINPREGDTANGRGRIRKISQTGFLTTFAGIGLNLAAQLTPLCEPAGLAFEPVSGSIFVSNRGLRDPQLGVAPAVWSASAGIPPCSRVLRIGTDQRVEHVAGSGEAGYSGDGGRSTEAKFLFPTALAANAAGDVYVSDGGNFRVRLVDRARNVRTAAGNSLFQYSAPATQAQRVFMANPQGLLLRNNQLYFADRGKALIKRIDLTTNTVTTVAGGGSISTEGALATNFPLIAPAGIAFDSLGAMFISDAGAHKIYKVTPPIVGGLTGDVKDGTIRTFLGTGQPGFCGDSNPANTGASVCLNTPSGMVMDQQDNLFFADRLNHRIRLVNRSTTVITAAGTGVKGYNGDSGAPTATDLSEPTNVHIAPDGSMLISDMGNSRLLRMSSDFTRMVTVVSGVRAPSGITTDRSGGIYLAEAGAHRIRYIAPNTGAVTSIAGTGEPGFEGDGGAARDALLNAPSIGLLLSPDGVLYLSDAGNDRIRLVTPTRPQLTVPATVVELTAASGQLSEASALRLTTDTPGLLVTTTANDNSWIRISPGRGKAPMDLRLYADATGLTPGDYQAQLTLTASNTNPPSRTVIVRLKVTGTPPPASLRVGTGSISLSAVRGGGAVSATIDLSNPGSGTLAVGIATSGQSWLSADPGTASISVGQNASVTVSCSPGDLPAGTYSGTVTFSSSANDVSVPVVCTVSDGGAKLLVSQSGLAFVTVEGGGTPLPQAIGVLNEGRGPMSWSASGTTLAGGDWLSLSSRSGSVSQPFLDVSFFDVRVDASGLTEGEYYGRIEIKAATVNSPQFVTVVLTVLPRGANPGPEVRPTGLVFTGTATKTAGSQDFSISNLGSGATEIVSSSITFDGGSWFRHAPNSIRVLMNRPATVTVQPNFAGLTPGVRRGVITILADDGSVRNVSLLSVVAPPDAANAAEKLEERAASPCPNPLRIQATSIREGFVAAVGQPTTIEVKVVDDCGQPLLQDPANAVAARFSNGDPQLRMVPLRDGVWSATWRPLRAVNGVVLITVSAYSRLGNVSRVTDLAISGAVRDQANTPIVGPGALRHSASFETGQPVAPGGLISILGLNLAQREAQVDNLPLPQQIDQTEVLLGGLALPLLYVNSNQINAQVPYDLTADTEHQILVRRGDTLSVPQLFNVVPAVPGIFTRNEKGFGQGIILKADKETFAEPGTPAERGEVIYLYCAGLGPVTPALASGVPAPEPGPATLLPITVEIGGKAATVRRSGLVPGVAGRYVVEAVVPLDAPTGDQIAITVSAGGQKSQQATLAIR